MLGGGLGAYLLTALPGEAVRPVVNACLLAMGALILWKAGRARRSGRPRRLGPLGPLGGLLDAVGGGSGPLRYLHSGGYARGGVAPRDRLGQRRRVLRHGGGVRDLRRDHRPDPPAGRGGLVIGDALAAPFAAYPARHLPERPLTILVGVLVVLLSARGLVQALGRRHRPVVAGPAAGIARVGVGKAVLRIGPVVTSP